MLRQFRQFKEVHFSNVYYSNTQGNNCILIGNKVRVIRNIVCESEESEKLALYEEFANYSDYFTYPLNSSDLNIYTVSEPVGELKWVNLSEVCKCVLLPARDQYIAILLIHSHKSHYPAENL